MDSIITKQAAKVISVNGNAFIKVNGKEVPIAEVLDLNAGTEIFVPEGANALLSLEDGTVLPVGEQDSPAQDILGSPLDDEIAAIQALIEEGVDPTEVLEATAAGGTTTSGAGSWSFQSIGRVGEQTIAQAGFDTNGIAQAFNSTRIEREDSGDSFNSFATSPEPTPITPTSPVNATLKLSSSTDEVSEDKGTISYKVEIVDDEGAPLTVTDGETVTVTITLPDGTEQDITIGSGSSEATFEYTVDADDVYKESEEASASINSVSGGESFDSLTTDSTPVTTIVTDDADTVTVSLHADTSEVSEDAGSIIYKVELRDAEGSLVTVAEGDSVEVTVLLPNGSSQKVTIEGGTSSSSFEFEVNRDDVYSGSSTASATINEVQGGDAFENLEASSDTVTVDIVDDNDAPTLTLSGDEFVAEGENATYTLTLSEPAAEDMTITVVVGHKTTEDGDVIPVEKTVTIKADTTSISFKVEALDDDLYEAGDDDKFTVSVTSVTGGGFEALPTLPSAVDTVINTDDSDRPDVASITSPTVTEGDTATFTVTLTNESTSDTTVTMTLASGSADKNVDFTGTTVTVNGDEVSVNADGTFEVTVKPGDTEFTVDVITTDNLDADGKPVFESTEDFTLSGKTDSQADAVTGTGTILDNDAPTLKVTGGGEVSEGKDITFNVKLSKAVDGDVTYSFDLGGAEINAEDITGITV
ncbi:retention module-containing protein, partial [Grimontia indica]|uniref:retention module-containing protein n=1 Tax=Grimontia indica TaxID=1056512 RepID=UPI0005875830